MNLAQIIKNAVCLGTFNTPDARISMSPLGFIPERPADFQGEPRSGAVLIVLFEEAKNLCVVLIKRRDGLRHHPGQISFPGGRLEKNEGPLDCALRETHEEIGIAPESLTVIGPLQSAYILASDFLVHPFVAWHPGTPICTANPHEVSEIFLVPLIQLDTPNVRTHTLKTVCGAAQTVPGFSFLNHHIWGATAMLLDEIIERLKATGWRE